MTHATSFGWRKEWEGRQLPECGRPRSFQHPILPCLETDWASRQGALCSQKRERGCIDIIVGISIYELVPTLCRGAELISCGIRTRSLPFQPPNGILAGQVSRTSELGTL